MSLHAKGGSPFSPVQLTLKRLSYTGHFGLGSTRVVTDPAMVCLVAGISLAAASKRFKDDVSPISSVPAT